ncbi:TetR/AcrR family transcriptional regulator C-terminal domain-containing protein [Microbacterium sp. ET2]|uniref:TetR/AcrR family transcriptional regulator n=1 Tax=Microbacterium albipurpureum TaxID=3050384 RepID=UPI00259C87DA|nr:TetR/AcrR family transcriptional regulator C-terminal domain-containing protein [Microbacterium sp. ET2 (Ac-2212)]WJL96456.1 TetR/AcrR family transcriptional regulator C-terminal domain-containing protein [Microbacterium sp. ET2 (Ac-2212)]
MTDDGDFDLPRGVALAWGVAANPQRGPKREMSVERIVEAALEIADSDGLSAVSMAAVAAKLGYTPMSLYRYVSAKEDLILLMQEDATGLPSDEARSAGQWRDGIRALYREQVALYLAHPWLLDIPITGAPTTPNSAAWMDAGLHVLAETPLPASERLAVILLVTGHARWAGIVFAAYARIERERGTDSDAVARSEDAVFRHLITADAFPDLRAAIDAGVFLDEADPFAFILELSLDGVAAHIDALAADGAVPPASAPWPESDDADIADDRRYREARRGVRQAEKALRTARTAMRVAAREARARRPKGSAAQ